MVSPPLLFSRASRARRHLHLNMPYLSSTIVNVLRYHWTIGEIGERAGQRVGGTSSRLQRGGRNHISESTYENHLDV